MSPIPHYLTTQVGDVSQVSDTGHKVYFGALKYGCKHGISLDEYPGFVFKYCIDEDSFRALPKGERPVVVEVNSSAFGSLVQNVEYVDP